VTWRFVVRPRRDSCIASSSLPMEDGAMPTPSKTPRPQRRSRSTSVCAGAAATTTGRKVLSLTARTSCCRPRWSRFAYPVTELSGGGARNVVRLRLQSHEQSLRAAQGEHSRIIRRVGGPRNVGRGIARESWLFVEPRENRAHRICRPSRRIVPPVVEPRCPSPHHHATAGLTNLQVGPLR
jgi:hypothetical protein